MRRDPPGPAGRTVLGNPEGKGRSGEWRPCSEPSVSGITYFPQSHLFQSPGPALSPAPARPVPQTPRDGAVPHPVAPSRADADFRWLGYRGGSAGLKGRLSNHQLPPLKQQGCAHHLTPLFTPAPLRPAPRAAFPGPQSSPTGAQGSFTWRLEDVLQRLDHSFYF